MVKYDNLMQIPPPPVPRINNATPLELQYFQLTMILQNEKI